MSNTEVCKIIIKLLEKEISWSNANKNMVNPDEFKGYINGLENSIDIIKQFEDIRE